MERKNIIDYKEYKNMRKDLIEYGYLWLDMGKISKNYAKYLIETNANVEVCALYEDNTESVVKTIEEIDEHYNNGGLFGVALEEYDDYVVFILGRDMLNDVLPSENDLAYDLCVIIAKDFHISEYNANNKGLYECVENYVNANLDKIKKNITQN